MNICILEQTFVNARFIKEDGKLIINYLLPVFFNLLNNLTLEGSL